MHGNPNFRRDVEHGQRHEASALRAVEEWIGEPVGPKQVFLDGNGKRVIPDGMVSGKPVEVKNVGPRTCNRGKNLYQLAAGGKNPRLVLDDNDSLQPNKMHRDFKQVQRQIDAADASHGYYGVHLNDEHGMVDDRVYRVSRDQTFIDKMKAKQKDIMVVSNSSRATLYNYIKFFCYTYNL